MNDKQSGHSLILFDIRPPLMFKSMRQCNERLMGRREHNMRAIL